MRSGARRAGLWAVSVLMIVSLLPMTAASARAEGPPGLITAAPEARTVGDHPAHVVRDRLVRVGVDHLFANGRARGKADLPRVRLDLFPDVSFIGEVTEVSTNGLGHSWVGDLAGVDDGYFLIAEADGAVAIHVASPEGVYEVSPIGNGLYRTIEIDQSQFADHPPGDYPLLAPDQPAGSPDVQVRDAGGTPVIDVIVLYTPAARSAWGGTAATKANIALAMTETNASYARSGVEPRLRLLHVQQVSYTEASANAFGVALDDLLYGTNGLDVAGILRDRYGADMVALIIDDSQYCGLAAGILPGEAYAYQVTAWNCATGYYSFGHEFGHLQGAHHDQYVATNSWFPDGHGYVHLDEGSPYHRWRTIMAYNDECVANSYNCVRLAWWSNPDKNVDDDPATSGWGSDPVGSGDATRNSKVLNDTAATVANWRRRVIGDDFDYRFTNRATNWKEITGNWWVNSNGYYVTRGVPGENASVKRIGKFGNLTYEVKMRRRGNQSQPNWIAIRGDAGKLKANSMWRPAYYLQYRAGGEYRILEVRGGGRVVTKVDWTPHGAIRTGDRWNRLKIVANGSTLRFYINGTRVKTIRDGSLKVGNVGFGFYTNKKKGQKLLVDWAKLENSPTA